MNRQHNAKLRYYFGRHISLRHVRTRTGVGGESIPIHDMSTAALVRRFARPYLKEELPYVFLRRNEADYVNCWCLFKEVGHA